MISFPAGNALSADQFEKQGNKFKPEMQLIVTPAMELESAYIKKLLNKYSPEFLAYWIEEAVGGSYSVEIQFKNKATANNALKEYNKAFKKGGDIYEEKKKMASKAKKKLICNRMYVLEDGKEFWYFGKWDNYGNLVGKVVADDAYLFNSSDKLAIENLIIHRTKLENATLVPIGKERWSF